MMRRSFTVLRKAELRDVRSKWPCRRSMGLVVVFTWLVLGPAAAFGQQVENQFSIAPALLRSDEATSVGARWMIRQAFGGRFTHDVFPRRVQGEAATRGAAALDSDANPETIEFSAHAGWFVALFKPPTDPDPTDPDAAPEGGFDYGSVNVGAAAALESDQVFETVNGVLGGRLAYVNSRQDYPWPLVPALQIRLAAILPVAGDTEPDSHTRADVNAAWHLPVGASPFVVHADIWYWNAFADDTAVERTYDGLYGSVALAYEINAQLSELALHEVFVRWSSGDAPVRADSRMAWMIGLVVGR